MPEAQLANRAEPKMGEAGLGIGAGNPASERGEAGPRTDWPERAGVEQHLVDMEGTDGEVWRSQLAQQDGQGPEE